MIHPLSTAPEIELALKLSRSRFALTLDAFFGTFAAVKERTSLETLILARIPDYLGFVKRIGFNLTKGRKIKPVPADPLVRWWSDLMKGSYPPAPKAAMGPDEMAVILYSGGTTGVPKGIMLSNHNFISEGLQVSVWGSMGGGNSTLAILPIFQVLDMATGNAARALGMGDRIGSLTEGKRADILVIRPDSPSPVVPASVLSWFSMSFQGRNVETVLVDGKPVVRDGRMTTVDEEKVASECVAEAKKLWKKNGVAV